MTAINIAVVKTFYSIIILCFLGISRFVFGYEVIPCGMDDTGKRASLVHCTLEAELSESELSIIYKKGLYAAGLLETALELYRALNSKQLFKPASLIDPKIVADLLKIKPLPDTHLRIYKIIYRTQRPHNEFSLPIQINTILSSGLIIVPVRSDSTRSPIANSPINLYHRGISFVDDNQLTETLSLFGFRFPKIGAGHIDLIAFASANQGFITLMPDSIGFNANIKRDLSNVENQLYDKHLYLHARSNAIAATDMLRASRTFCERTGHCLPSNENLITGSSEGGQIGIATHKILEQSHPELPIKAAAFQSGLYNPADTILYFLKHEMMAEQLGVESKLRSLIFKATLASALSMTEIYNIGPKELIFNTEQGLLFQGCNPTEMTTEFCQAVSECRLTGWQQGNSPPPLACTLAGIADKLKFPTSRMQIFILQNTIKQATGQKKARITDIFNKAFLHAFVNSLENPLFISSQCPLILAASNNTAENTHADIAKAIHCAMISNRVDIGYNPQAPTRISGCSGDEIVLNSENFSKAKKQMGQNVEAILINTLFASEELNAGDMWYNNHFGCIIAAHTLDLEWFSDMQAPRLFATPFSLWWLKGVRLEGWKTDKHAVNLYIDGKLLRSNIRADQFIHFNTNNSSVYQACYTQSYHNNHEYARSLVRVNTLCSKPISIAPYK